MIPYSRYLFYPVTWYSVLILSGAVLAILLGSRLEKREGLPKDTVIDLALWLLPFSLIGARCYYVVFSWSSYREDLLSVFRIWEGGMAIYGGILAGLLVALVFCRRRHLPFLSVCDVIVPGLALAQAIGRWGNYFNMEAYGRAISDPALCFFPLAVLVPSADGYAWHMATFFYESVWDFAVFVFLTVFIQRDRSRQRGDLFRLYVFLYAAGRLAIEELREDSLYSGSIRISQLLSILAMIILIVWLMRNRIAARGAGAIPAAVRVLVFPAAIASCLVLAYAVKLPFFPEPAFPANLLLLLAFSLLSLILFLTLFFHRRNSDSPQT